MNKLIKLLSSVQLSLVGMLAFDRPHLHSFGTLINHASAKTAGVGGKRNEYGGYKGMAAESGGIQEEDKVASKPNDSNLFFANNPTVTRLCKKVEENDETSITLDSFA